MRRNTLRSLAITFWLGLTSLSAVVAEPLRAECPVSGPLGREGDSQSQQQAKREDGAKAHEGSDSSSKEEKKEPVAKKVEKPKDRYFAVKSATIHTVTGSDWHNATILAKNGKISAFGWSIPLPEDAEILDATGYHLYPGLIAVNSSGIFGSDSPEDTTNVYSLSMTMALAAGITTAVSGNSAVKLSLGSVEDMLLKRDVFVTLNYSTGEPAARYKTREGLEKVRQYLRELKAFEEKKKTDPKAKEPDKEWIKGEYEGYMKLLRRDAIGLVSADTAHQILDACELAESFAILLVVRGAQEGWTVPARIARAGASVMMPVRLGLFFTDRKSDERLNRPNGWSIENAAILHRHGVRVAVFPANPMISTWGLAGRDLLQLNMEAAFAVRGGLPPEAALRSITMDAARILGVDDRVGSIEIGKDADFMIIDGDPLHYMSFVRWTVVNGRLVYDKQKETLYSHIRPEGNQDAPPPDDYWPRRLGVAP